MVTAAMTGQDTVQSRYWRLRGLAGLELMRASFRRHAFARHGHETFAVGVIQAGAEEIWFRDGVERVGPGELVLIGPEVVHTGATLSDRGLVYRVLYPSAAVLAELAGSRGTPSFRQRTAYDEQVAALVVAAHSAAETEGPLHAEAAVMTALEALVRRHGSAPGTGTGPARGRAVEQARAILADRLIDPPSLEQLALEVGARPFGLLRAFRDAYGLPPHAYLTQLRIRRARTLLAAGRQSADVATTVGFFDQAHLTRHFRRLVGVTPGEYRAAGSASG
jgi:AraC-like DNA-binding protein